MNKNLILLFKKSVQNIKEDLNSFEKYLMIGLKNSFIVKKKIVVCNVI